MTGGTPRGGNEGGGWLVSGGPFMGCSFRSSLIQKFYGVFEGMLKKVFFEGMVLQEYDRDMG